MPLNCFQSPCVVFKLEQAQKKHEVDQCQSQSSFIAEVSSHDEAPAAKRL